MVSSEIDQGPNHKVEREDGHPLEGVEMTAK